MSLQVFTAPIRYAKGGFPNGLDITRASGRDGLFLAPSWEILVPAVRARRSVEAARGKPFEATAIRREGEAWAVYEPAFTAEMRYSYRSNRAAWDALLAMERVVLCCYCPTSDKCHRGILRKTILPKLGAIDCGELPKIPPKQQTIKTI